MTLLVILEQFPFFKNLTDAEKQQQVQKFSNKYAPLMEEVIKILQTLGLISRQNVERIPGHTGVYSLLDILKSIDPDLMSDQRHREDAQRLFEVCAGFANDHATQCTSDPASEKMKEMLNALRMCRNAGEQLLLTPKQLLLSIEHPKPLTLYYLRKNIMDRIPTLFAEKTKGQEHFTSIIQHPDITYLQAVFSIIFPHPRQATADHKALYTPENFDRILKTPQKLLISFTQLNRKQLLNQAHFDLMIANAEMFSDEQCISTYYFDLRLEHALNRGTSADMPATRVSFFQPPPIPSPPAIPAIVVDSPMSAATTSSITSSAQHRSPPQHTNTVAAAASCDDLLSHQTPPPQAQDMLMIQQVLARPAAPVGHLIIKNGHFYQRSYDQNHLAHDRACAMQ